MSMPPNASPEQIGVRATWMRGGTSKALFFLADDLPPEGPERDTLIKRLMGCPHPLQIDGMGGGRGNTSKIAIVGRSRHPGADVDYTFAQVGIDEDFIDYRATCGNISAAVGPFAIAHGLVTAEAPSTHVRIYNSNIDDLLFQDVPVAKGAPLLSGGFVNAGVPGTGAEIFTDFSRAIGRRTGQMLPTGSVRDELRLSDGSVVQATLLDVGNPVAYIPARELGLEGTELPAALQALPDLLPRIAELRMRAAEAMGIAGRFSVRIGLVSEPTDYRTIGGHVLARDAMDLCARFFALDYCAPNYPGSASVSTGAAARLPGSVVHDVLPLAAQTNGPLRIGHPSAVMTMIADARDGNGDIEMVRLGFGRTARTIMEGLVYTPALPGGAA